jgi:predicted DNA-binding transcriptional regulator AlpA
MYEILDDYLSEDEAITALGYKHKRTLWRWRTRGEGPPFVKIGRRVMYRRSSLATWLAGQEQAAA